MQSLWDSQSNRVSTAQLILQLTRNCLARPTTHGVVVVAGWIAIGTFHAIRAQWLTATTLTLAKMEFVSMMQKKLCLELVKLARSLPTLPTLRKGSRMVLWPSLSPPETTAGLATKAELLTLLIDVPYRLTMLSLLLDSEVRPSPRLSPLTTYTNCPAQEWPGLSEEPEGAIATLLLCTEGDTAVKKSSSLKALPPLRKSNKTTGSSRILGTPLGAKQVSSDSPSRADMVSQAWTRSSNG